MSDALTYLVKARPEAVGHYLQFLKASGRSLDPKTRDLISVITKVHAQTERGLRQYLNRALRDGCTPAEILDALLMAFPALGLTKIVWAVDIILAMKLPGFDLDALHGNTTWHDLIALSDVPEGRALRVDCDGRGVFVHRRDGKVTVYDSRCPHQATDLQQSALDGTTLTCPTHGWSFDITSGACIRHGNSPLRQFPSRIAEGRVQANW